MHCKNNKNCNSKCNCKNEKKDLKIYPVNIDESNLGRLEKNILLDIPFLLTIIGRVKAGKSIIVNNLALNHYKADFDHIIVISPTIYSDPINQHLAREASFAFENYSDDLIDEIIEIVENDEDNGRYLLILDDVIGNIKFRKNTSKVDKITELSTKYRHIANNETGDEGRLSIIITTQQFKFLSNILRFCSTGFIIAGMQSPAELKAMSEELSSFTNGKPDQFIDIYKKSKKKPFDFLYLSMNDMNCYRNFEDILNIKKEEEQED